MNRSQLKAKAHRRAIRNEYRMVYGKDMWIEFYCYWLRMKRGDL